MGKFNYRPILLCIATALMLMGICFYNGYPVYWADAHAYLSTAFTDVIPADRPVFYGKFIRITSMWTSLWWTVFAQCLLLAYLLLRFIRVLNPGGAVLRFRLVAVIMVAAFTAVSWVCAVLTPDIFTGILLLAILVYLFDTRSSKATQWVYVLIIFLSVITHNSHFPIIALFSAILIGWSMIKKNRVFFKKGLVILSSGVFFYVLMCTINYADKKKFVFSPSSDVFMMAHFATNGMLDRYLDDSCGKKNLKLCVAKGQISAYHWDFLWPPQSSPLAKLGVWDSCSTEFHGIVHDMFTTPAYVKMFVQKSMIATCRQLFTIEVEKFATPPADDWRSDRLKMEFKDEFKEFSTSKQVFGGFDSGNFNLVYNLFFALTTIGVLLLFSPRDNKEIYLVYTLMLVFFVINAFVTANLSVVVPRFQNRIFWILPATNAILLLKYLRSRFRSILQ